MDDKVILEQCGTSNPQMVWKNSPSQVFWGEIAPLDHALQVYENDKIFLNTLEGFAGAGLIAGDSIVVIATPAHLSALENRLIDQGFRMEFLKAVNRYIALDAGETLNQFMVDNQPDENLFRECMTRILQQASKNNGKVRAFGEMVALLWDEGLHDATIRVEKLWHDLQHEQNFTLFCAYSKSCFSNGKESLLDAISAAHSVIIDGTPQPSTEVHYRNA